MTTENDSTTQDFTAQTTDFDGRTIRVPRGRTDGTDKVRVVYAPTLAEHVAAKRARRRGR